MPTIEEIREWPSTKKALALFPVDPESGADGFCRYTLRDIVRAAGDKLTPLFMNTIADALQYIPAEQRFSFGNDLLPTFLSVFASQLTETQLNDAIIILAESSAAEIMRIPEELRNYFYKECLPSYIEGVAAMRVPQEINANIKSLTIKCAAAITLIPEGEQKRFVRSVLPEWCWVAGSIGLTPIDDYTKAAALMPEVLRCLTFELFINPQILPSKEKPVGHDVELISLVQKCVEFVELVPGFKQLYFIIDVIAPFVSATNDKFTLELMDELIKLVSLMSDELSFSALSGSLPMVIQLVGDKFSQEFMEHIVRAAELMPKDTHYGFMKGILPTFIEKSQAEGLTEAQMCNELLIFSANLMNALEPVPEDMHCHFCAIVVNFIRSNKLNASVIPLGKKYAASIIDTPDILRGALPFDPTF